MKDWRQDLKAFGKIQAGDKVAVKDDGVTDYRVLSEAMRVPKLDLERDYKDVAYDLDAARKSAMDYMDKQIHDQIVGEVTTSSVAHQPAELTLEKLAQIYAEVKRVDHVYIMESKHIPDDAIGVLWVRPEDARRIKK